LEALRDRAEPSDPQRSGPDEGLLATSFIALGVGGLGLASMGLFGGLALGEHDALAAGCGATRTCTESDIATSEAFAVVADVSLGIAAAAVTLGVVLLIYALSASGGPSQNGRLRSIRSGVALVGEGVISW
jgi:hypothetical protein